MDISLLNQKITFEKNETLVDEIGNHSNSWSTYYSCFAGISGESGTENEKAGQIISEETITFKVRICNLLKDLNTTNFRIVYNDNAYNILSIDHLSYKQNFIKLKCKKKTYGW